jgi:hypothetical protein
MAETKKTIKKTATKKRTAVKKPAATKAVQAKTKAVKPKTTAKLVRTKAKTPTIRTPTTKTPKTRTPTARTPTAKAPGRPVARPVARRRRPGDRGLGKILAERSADKIVPEVARRLEGARKSHVDAAVKAAEAERALLEAEAARLEKEGDAGGRKAGRIARFRAAVETEARSARETAGAIERRIEPERGGWSVIGRVVDRKGVSPAKTQVVFVDEKNVPVKGLAPITVGKDGMVRQSYPAATVAKLVRVRVAAAARVGTKIVAVDDARTLVGAGRLHQFDIRIT